MTATKLKPATKKRKPTIQKVDITKLNNRQLEALDEDVFIASLKPWLRKFMIAAKPFRGKLK